MLRFLIHFSSTIFGYFYANLVKSIDIEPLATACRATSEARPKLGDFGSENARGSNDIEPLGERSDPDARGVFGLENTRTSSDIEPLAERSEAEAREWWRGKHMRVKRD